MFCPAHFCESGFNHEKLTFYYYDLKALEFGMYIHMSFRIKLALLNLSIKIYEMEMKERIF